MGPQRPLVELLLASSLEGPMGNQGGPSPTSEAGACWERQCQPHQAMGGAGR